MRVNDALGRFGEQVACDHLEAAGLIILSRNWRCPAGELDLVALEGSTLVMVEVKTRSSLRFGTPAEAVDRRKAARIRRLAARWIEADRGTGGSAGTGGTEGADPPPRGSWTSVRFDVVSVVRRAGSGVDVDHLIGAF